MAFQVRWENNNLEWYTDNPSGEDLEGQFWSSNLGFAISGIPGSYRVRSPGFYYDDYYIPSAFSVIDEYGDGLTDGDARPVIDFLGSEDAICTGYEIEYTPIDGAENSSFGWTYQPWGEGMEYVYDPSLPNDEYYKNIIPNLGNYSKKTFSFNMLLAAETQNCGHDDGYFDEEEGVYIPNILDYGYCPQKLIYWEFAEGRYWKYWWPRICIFGGVAKIHNVKIKFSSGVVPVAKFWTGFRGTEEYEVE